MLHLFSFLISNYLKPSPGGGVLSEKMGGGGDMRHSSETFSLFQTKICVFPYLFTDLIKFDTLFQTCLIISSLGQTNVKDNVYTLLLRRIQKSSNVGLKGKWSYHLMTKKKLLLKNIPNSRLGCTNHTLFQTKTAKNPYPLVPHLPQ